MNVGGCVNVNVRLRGSHLEGESCEFDEKEKEQWFGPIG